MASTLFIRADAHSAIGTGHVMRMTALAQAWQDEKGDVVFVSRIESEALRARLTAEGFLHVEPRGVHPDPADSESLLALSSPGDWIAIDGYCFDSDFMRALHESRRRCLVMDDVNDRGRYLATMLVNQNADAGDYEYDIEPGCMTLKGPRNALLRKEFLAKEHATSPVRQKASRLLMTFGGADVGGMTAKALGTLAEAELDEVSVKVVVGSLAPTGPSLSRLVEKLNISCEVMHGVDDMAPLMEWADVAMTAAGSVCWEFCLFGVPMIVWSVADNQSGIARSLVSGGIALDGNNLSAKALTEFMDDAVVRQAMSESGRKTVDGKGAFRLVRAMKAFDLCLRPVVFDDWRRLLEWRNHPATRSKSFSLEEIEQEAHQCWLRSNLEDGDNYFFIGELNGDPVGQIRFDSVAGGYETSVGLAPEAMGRGLGGALICLGCREVFKAEPGVRIFARVKEANAASRAVFAKAGFAPIESYDGVVRYELGGKR